MRRLAGASPRRCCWSSVAGCTTNATKAAKTPARPRPNHPRLPPPSRPSRPVRSPKRPISTAFRWSTTTACSTPTSSTRTIPSTRAAGTRSTTPPGFTPPPTLPSRPPTRIRPTRRVGADLRTEPLVLTVPPIEQNRYYSLQFVDGYTYNFAYVGSRTTGNSGGKYLLAGPNWKGDKPEGVNEVIRSDTDLAFVLYRTQLFGPDRHRQRQEDSGRLSGRAAVGVPEPAVAAAGSGDRLRAAADRRTAADVAAVLRYPEFRAQVRADAARGAGTARPVRHHRDRPRRLVRRREAEPGDAHRGRGRNGRCVGRIRHA